MQTVTLDVKGMSCQGCVGSVTRVLKATPGVESVDVQLASGKAQVSFDPARASLDQLRRAVEDAGYDIA